MLNWSNGAYKMTFGVGALGMAGMMCSIIEPRPQFWLVLVAVFPPIVLVLFLNPAEVGARIARFAHLSAAVYFLASTALLFACYFSRVRDRTWWLIVLFQMPGTAASVLILFRACIRWNTSFFTCESIFEFVTPLVSRLRHRKHDEAARRLESVLENRRVAPGDSLVALVPVLESMRGMENLGGWDYDVIDLAISAARRLGACTISRQTP